MASHNSKFILNNFVLTGVQGIDMSSYIRKYAHYLNEKRETYKLMGFGCQLDALVQFDVTNRLVLINILD